MQRVPVPRTLDAPPRFLFWDFDVVAVFAFAFMVGMILVGISLALVLSIAAWHFWSRARAGRGVAKAFALLYWYTPLDFFIRAPASARRHFIG